MKKIYSLKKLSPFLALAVLLALSLAQPAYAQESDTLNVSVNRIMGYSSGFLSSGVQEIQGSFNISATGPSNLKRVVFYIDNTVIGEDSAPPFKLQFNTDSYPQGVHTFSAKGYTTDEKELSSNNLQAKIVTAQQGMQQGFKIAGPILLIVLLAMILSFAATFVSAGKLRRLEPGEARSYGTSGGAICGNCGRPFPLHALSMHLGFLKLERCPFCGKWGLQKRRSLDELRAAEQAELKGAQPQVQEETEEEKLRREIEESKYRGG